MGAGLATAWVASITATPEVFDAFAAARLPIAGVFTLTGGWLAIDRRWLAERLLSPARVGMFDLVYLPTVLAVVAGAVLFLGLSPLVAAAVLALALAVYPAGRRAVAAAAERLIMGDLRRRAELRAIEAERGRMAREIHDAPLQELAAVIRRLEVKPDTGGETMALREVAASLRGVASALHPPVLEDLGLAAAITDLAEQVAADHPEGTVTAHVDDLVTAGARPDPEAEVAAFRIAQEALANAISHSASRDVSVGGMVSGDAIDLEIADTGTGIDPQAVWLARRGGHFGLDSMRERALAVGGELAIDSDERGVRVHFTWERRP